MGNTLLLADKSVTIQKIVQLTFADEDYKITCVNDGQSALDIIPQIHPSVILADIGLPVKNGYDLCTTLRRDPAFSAYANTPVILLAGIYETMDEERAKHVEERVKEVGANGLLSKPFDPQLLTSKVKELIEQGASAALPPAAMPAPEPMFAEAPAPAEDVFGEASASSEMSFRFDDQPPDETEKTMMLTASSFGTDMFAPAPPAIEEPVEPPEPVVEAAKPQGEIAFEERAPETSYEEPALPAPEIEPPPEPAIAAPVTQYESPAFPGFQEPEMALDSGAQEPFGEEAQRPEEEPAIVADSGDPFGDVFAEPPAPPSWTPPAVSEEESPFGLPEPPPPPAPEPAALVEPAAAAESAAAVEEAFNEPLEEPAVPMEEEEREQVEEMMGQPALVPEFGEDTWSRAKAQADTEQPVEELFEATEQEPETAAAFGEVEEELEPDTSSGIEAPQSIPYIPEPEPVSAPAPAPVAVAPAAAPAVPSGTAVEITEDVIERIAQRVVEKLSERVVSDIVWQVVPDLAEKMIRRELEKLHAGGE